MAEREDGRDPIAYSAGHKKYPLEVPPHPGAPPRRSFADKAMISVLLACMFAYFVFALWIDDLTVPLLRGGGRLETHVHGVAIWLLLAAFACYVVYRVVYGDKEREADPSGEFSLDVKDVLPRHSGKLAWTLALAGWLLFMAGLAAIVFAA